MQKHKTKEWRNTVQKRLTNGWDEAGRLKREEVGREGEKPFGEAGFGQADPREIGLPGEVALPTAEAFACAEVIAGQPAKFNFGFRGSRCGGEGGGDQEDDGAIGSEVGAGVVGSETDGGGEGASLSLAVLE